MTPPNTPHDATQGGSAFVIPYAGASTVEANVIAQIAATGVTPTRVLVMAGTNDGGSSELVVETAMMHLDTTLSALGVRVTWLTEPFFLRPHVAALNAWVVQRPDHIDCAAAAGTVSADGVHPNTVEYYSLAQCITLRLG